MGSDIRPSPIAGQWYSNDPTVLGVELDGYLSRAKIPPISGDIVGVISPHAGYRYSGPVAGHAFAAIRDLKPELVAVISPMHHPYNEGFLTSGHDYYWTPLGKIPVDKTAVAEVGRILHEENHISLISVLNDPEHSLEIELPFLQRIYTHRFSLLPVMVRDLSLTTCEALGKALYRVLKEKSSIVVISTDLSHFYTEEEANGYDTYMLNMIGKLSPEEVLKAELKGDGFACGAGAVIAGLYYALLCGATTGMVLKYGTSGERTGDYSSVVGYGAVALIKPL
jgi:hypothetical protein